MRSPAIERLSWCWWSYTPSLVRSLITTLADRPGRRRLQAAVKTFLAQNDAGWTDEQAEVARFLREHPCQALPYPFAMAKPKIEVLRDPVSKLRFVLHDGKRLYFPRTWAAAKIEIYFRGLLIEQDLRSPHRYELAPCAVREGDVVVDAGASEGFFALSVIERCSKAYLIECDELWTEPLRQTFAPWRDKAVFVNAWLSDRDAPAEGLTTLDTLLGDVQVHFLKADIEGAECALVRGSRTLMARSPTMRLAVCTYHTDSDAATLETLLSQAGFSTVFSHGFMVWLTDRGLSLRRGVLRATKRLPPEGPF